MKKKANNWELGFSMIEMLTLVGFLGVLTYSILSLSKFSAKTSTSSLVTFQADAFRKKIIALVQNDQAWQNTLNDATNDTLACLRTGSDCTAAGGPFAVKDASNKLFYDPRPATNGFALSGEPCPDFDAANGNNRCPLRLTLAWQAVCDASPCFSPQVKILGTMTFKPKEKDDSKAVSFNGNNYGVNLIRGANTTGLGTGTPGTIVKWISQNEVGNSIITEDNGKIGVGAATPASVLDVNGSVSLGTYAGNTAAPAGGLIVSGNVGIGVSTPKSKLDVQGGARIGSDPAACVSEKAGTVRWNGAAFEGCQPSASGYAWCPLSGCISQDCVPGSNRTCAITKGTGSQNCDAQGRWGPCTYTCYTGYALMNGVCVPLDCGTYEMSCPINGSSGHSDCAHNPPPSSCRSANPQTGGCNCPAACKPNNGTFNAVDAKHIYIRYACSVY